jgi:hypothetical protein
MPSKLPQWQRVSLVAKRAVVTLVRALAPGTNAGVNPSRARRRKRRNRCRDRNGPDGFLVNGQVALSGKSLTAVRPGLLEWVVLILVARPPTSCQQFFVRSRFAANSSGRIAVGGRKLHKLLPRGFRLSGIARPLRGRRRAV